MEKVQIFALRMCAQDYRLSYEELLETFGLPSLENHSLYVDSTILFVGLLFPSFTSGSLQHFFKSSCDVLCTLLHGHVPYSTLSCIKSFLCGIIFQMSVYRQHQSIVSKLTLTLSLCNLYHWYTFTLALLLVYHCTLTE